MLSALHGIGVILLNPENPTESEILIAMLDDDPEVDWQSINRILTENLDFKNFIELVSIYLSNWTYSFTRLESLIH